MAKAAYPNHVRLSGTKSAMLRWMRSSDTTRLLSNPSKKHSFKGAQVDRIDKSTLIGVKHKGVNCQFVWPCDHTTRFLNSTSPMML